MKKKLRQFDGICKGRPKQAGRDYCHGIGVIARGRALIIEGAEGIEDILNVKISQITEIYLDSLEIINEV